jgi:hypothetical protein
MLTAEEKEKRKLHYKENKQKYKDKAKEWKQENPDKRRLSNRKSQIKATYGISWDEYEKMYNECEGRCHICHCFLHLAPTKQNSSFSACVDHDHITGKVRGLLCKSCNVALGFFKDSEFSLTNALLYLKKHRDFT